MERNIFEKQRELNDRLNSQLVLFEIKNYNMSYGGAKWTI